MTKQEFSMYAMALRTFYPREKLLQTQEAMELWYQLLKDLPYAKAQSDLIKWAQHHRWSPSIAEILGNIDDAGAYSVGMDDFITMLEDKNNEVGALSFQKRE